MNFEIKRNDYDNSVEFRGRLEAREIAEADLMLRLPAVGFGDPVYVILNWLCLVYMHGHGVVAQVDSPEQLALPAPHGESES